MIKVDCRVCGGDGWLPSRSDDGPHRTARTAKGTGKQEVETPEERCTRQLWNQDAKP